MQASILNKTTYSKQFYKKIASSKIFKDPITFLGTIACCFACYTGTTTLMGAGINIIAIIYLVLGLIIVPIFCFFLPYSNNCKAYDRMMELTKNKEFYAETKFSNLSFNMKNSLGQSELHDYKDIKSINIKNDLIIINLKKGNPIYMDKNSFVSSSYNEFKEYITTTASIKIND